MTIGRCRWRCCSCRSYGEAPVGRAAGHVGEAGTEVEPGQGLGLDTLGGAGRAVRRAVVGAGVAVDDDGRVGLVDDDLDVAASRFVVAVTGEAPVGWPPGTLVNEAPRSSPRQVLAIDAGSCAGSAMSVAVVVACVAVDVDGRRRPC